MRVASCLNWNPNFHKKKQRKKCTSYIIGHYNISYVLCFNFIREWRDPQVKVDTKRQIVENLFHSNYICSQSFYQNSAERKRKKKYNSENQQIYNIFIIKTSLTILTN